MNQNTLKITEEQKEKGAKQRSSPEQCQCWMYNCTHETGAFKTSRAFFLLRTCKLRLFLLLGVLGLPSLEKTVKKIISCLLLAVDLWVDLKGLQATPVGCRTTLEESRGPLSQQLSTSHACSVAKTAAE